ncbi:hypothetical protein [Streptomyces sp. NRRL WC-3605]|nr:hypothetical protein [Streptomyces sp. NRRL WC-3605]
MTHLTGPGHDCISRRGTPRENVEFDDIEFIETAEELLATSYYKNIQ